MDKISKHNVVHKYEKKQLLWVINGLAGLSIFFFGYDQGMMGGVNNAYDYYHTTMKFGYPDPVSGSPIITDSLLQGGIVSVYYLGTLMGCLVGGWFGDKYGRIKTIALGAAWAVFGACLQCSAQNATWMIFARLINGWGTGILNAIVPVYATETAEYTSRGAFVSLEFTLNILGVVVAYWLEYGCAFYKDGRSAFAWRFPIAFQILPLLGLIAIVWFFPESPRWLAKVGRDDEARYILGRLRGEEDGVAQSEFEEVQAAVSVEKDLAAQQSYVRMFFGIGDKKLHVARRVQLVIWLQIIQEWVGIAGVTVYAPTIFRIAGIGNKDSQWISGLNNVTYMFATLICVFTLDRIGRRWTLYWGAVVQGIAMFLAGGLSRLGEDARAEGNLSRATMAGNGAVFFVYLFTFVFGATWLVVPWIYPAEIFPAHVRAKGNALGVFGWSIGNGWLTLLCPVMFNAIGEKTLYIFGASNFIGLAMVWAFYPETSQRTLEEMDMLFASDSWFVWDAEKEFARQVEANPNLAHVNRGRGKADIEDADHA